MNCLHELRAVNPLMSGDVEIVGAPPQTKTEPAWCRICGVLWAKGPFGIGWGFVHPLRDSGAPTLLNLLRDTDEEDMS